ncbi:phytanoyl-CoA dioxygenase family protein [Variovorax ginsengisoli]|uniref:Phytanoyl-CoA dioxygenase family protein n=1 Tax=Variovorax ginsengisoli TaxID=363844 RepID=A0ABT8RZA0_9BURK|nr:phytanoyl-CoA dioxygenase family protein [Variovorax ginsengisoli]MDN8612832.1 phytanoyl-CoA dioxygenase family protein [Variovorax ginsengisoli]MDO1532002.1 phytanoyl-CoA dioxygenase family protein [Variovorax ginsengisoli]
MTTERQPPTASYGVLDRTAASTSEAEAVEQIRELGYAVVDAGYSPDDIARVAQEFDRVRAAYVGIHGEALLKRAGEFDTIRAMLIQGSEIFVDLALNSTLMSLLKRLIGGKFILNQQNGIVNPPQQGYSQSAWHRDLPYQHFVTTTPLAINALYCIDDFTVDNGATFVLPASHKSAAFPSSAYVSRNAVQVAAKAGSFIVLDCMMFHAGGFNTTSVPRRAVNHMFNIPYFKQQINIPLNMDGERLSPEARDVLGFNYIEPRAVADYLGQRAARK